MKKTVILALSLIYLASILIVQFFGLRVMDTQGTQLVSEIIVQSVELTNRQAGQSTVVKPLQNEDGNLSKKSYAFTFYHAEEGTVYENTSESLAKNPNRLKINYEVKPYDAANKSVSFNFNNENVVFLEETSEFVFLKRSGLVLELRAKDSSQVSVNIEIVSTVQEIK